MSFREIENLKMIVGCELDNSMSYYTMCHIYRYLIDT